MVGIKPICERFDNLYDLAGGKEIESVKKLKIQIKEALDDPINISGIIKDWLIWMYGKVANKTPEIDADIMAHYANIVTEYDQLSRKIAKSEKYRCTSMYKMMQLSEKVINELKQEPNVE
jgi:hypothetical protein